MSSRLSRRAPVTLAVLGYLIVGVLYLEALPPWEAPDEPLHLAYAEALVAGRLPAAEETWEAHHPPLYYLLPALALRVAGVEAVARAPGNPRMPFATAAVWHAPDDPAIGILRLVRAFSSLIGSLAVVLAWAASREVFRGAVMRPALAACLVALLPQYLFITHSVSSDTLAAVVGALAVYVLVGWASGRLGDKTAASALAVVAVLGLYTKLNTLPVLAASLPIALGLVIVRYVRSRFAPGSCCPSWRGRRS
jgi:dolichyl-phosphate-mannose--protein O-mannosyl transferase